MVRLTQTAEGQVDHLLDWYVERERYRAAQLLLDTVATAISLIEQGSTGRAWPGPYRDAAAWGYEWLLVHRYWIAFVRTDDGAIITNVFEQTSDIPNRIMPVTPPEVE